MKKLKNICAAVLVSIFAASLFAGCSKDKNESGNPTPVPTPTPISYVDRTFSNYGDNSVNQVSVASYPANNFARTVTKNEEEMVSVKLDAEGNAYLVYDLAAYVGTYTTDSSLDNKFYLSFTDKEDSSVSYNIEMVASDNSVELTDTSIEDKLIEGNSLTLGEKEDFVFENGLYLGLGSFSYPFGKPNGAYSDQIEGGSYTYKVSDNEIYSGDSATNVSKLNLIVLANQIIYSVKYDVLGESGETNLFFIGEHDDAFVEYFGDIDDVIYQVEYEGGKNNRYYFNKIADSDVELRVAEQLTFNSTAIFRSDFENSVYQRQAINMTLNINVDGSLNLVVSENEDFNGTYTGRWYNISNGLIMVFDQQTSLFTNCFTIGTYPNEYGATNINDLLNIAITEIYYSDSVVFELAWTTLAYNSLNGSQFWSVVDSFIEKQ